MSKLDSVPMHPVRSSNIGFIGHLENSLYIKFNSGIVYKYSPFSRERFDEFMDSKSKGSYFLNNIKEDDSLKYETV